MNKIGLKLYSANRNYIRPAQELFVAGEYEFIELLPVPGSLADTLPLWRGLGIPFVIHAPHFLLGVNLAQADKYEGNMRAIRETLAFADALEAEKIVVHPGTEGDIYEAARQIKAIKDPRILIENKPYMTIDGKYKCVGSSMDEIRVVMKTAGVGFCLDVGHAISHARSTGCDIYEYLKDFSSLGPAMFHVSDGDAMSGVDQHVHIGEGNFDWGKIVPLFRDGAMITVETQKDSATDLDDFRRDARNLKRLLCEAGAGMK